MTEAFGHTFRTVALPRFPGMHGQQVRVFAKRLSLPVKVSNASPIRFLFIL